MTATLRSSYGDSNETASVGVPKSIEMKSWFFPQRLGRLAWLGRMFLFVVPAVLLIVHIGPRGSLRPYLGNAIGEIIGWSVIAIVLFYTLAFVHLPRCRSLGLHGAALVLLFIPPINVLVWMMFLFGGEGYWPRMRERQRAVMNPNDQSA
jgi:hypothetical protein